MGGIKHDCEHRSPWKERLSRRMEALSRSLSIKRAELIEESSTWHRLCVLKVTVNLMGDSITWLGVYEAATRELI